MPNSLMKWVYLLSAFCLLCGCASTRLDSEFGPKCPKDLDGQLKALDMKGLFHDLAADLCQSGTGSRGNAVLVTDFVDLDSLKPNSSGILMGELMRDSLNAVCGNTIQQAELSKYFVLGPSGLAVLTRQGDAIRQDEVGNRDFIVGTFSQSPDKLILFAKRFNMADNLITKSSSKEITFTCSDWGASYKIR